MSSIAGIISLDHTRTVSESKVKAMLKAMRPSLDTSLSITALPDNNAIFGKLTYKPDTQTTKGFTLNNNLFCVAIGEIYRDSPENIQSLSEYLCHRYFKYGVQYFSNGLNGSFSAVIGDRKAGSVTLITDHMASCPIFTTIRDKKFYFASEVKGLLALDEIPAEVDLSGLASLIAYEFYIDNRSLVKNIYKMDYATICHISKDGRIQHLPYWRYSIEPKEKVNDKDLLEQFKTLLCLAVKRRIRNGRVGILLSGGYDSRGILCCIDDHSLIPAFSFTPNTKESRSNHGDWAVAEEVSNYLKMDHTSLHFRGENFGKDIIQSVFGSDGAAGYIFENVWDEYKNDIDVDYLLMGDQCMLWKTFTLNSTADVFSAINIAPFNAYKQLNSILNNEIFSILNKEIDSICKKIISENKARSYWDFFYEIYYTQRMVNFMIPKRRLLSRYGFQVRNPWLDLDILNFVRKLPEKLRTDKILFRRAIRQLNSKIMRLPIAKQGESIDYQTFVYEAEQNKSEISKLIFNDNPIFENFFNIEAVKEFIADLCSSKNAIQIFKEPSTFGFVPKWLRPKLWPLAKLFFNPTRRLSGINLLFRVAVVSSSLRFLSKRFRRYK